jgi:sensor histidine kinase YesM
MTFPKLMLIAIATLFFFCWTLAQDPQPAWRNYNTDPIAFSGNDQIISIGSYVSIFEDPTNQLSVQEVMASGRFKMSTQKVPNLGLSNSSFWIQFQVRNLSRETNFLLELAQPTTDEVTLYSIVPSGKITATKMGEYLPFSNRQYQEPNYLFDLYIPKNKDRVYLMRLKSKELLLLPLSIGSNKSIFDRIKYKDIFSGIYIGLMLTMIFYNLFLYLSIRDKNYLYYVVYVASVLLIQMSTQGYSFQLLWPNSPWMQIHCLFLYTTISGITVNEFSKEFLQIRKRAPLLWKGTFVFHVTYTISLLAALLGFYVFSFNLINISAGLISIYLLVTAAIISKEFRPARFYLIAWSGFLIGIVIYVLKDFNVLPYNNFTRYAMQIGSAFETVLLSFALADRINILKREKEADQIRMLEFQNSALRSQMNPHFIFNALNAIQGYTAQGDKLAANRFLSRFSKLIRTALQHSRVTKVPLEDDLSSLKNYLELEQLRFQDSFDFQIKVADNIDKTEVTIPSMLIQPFVENAIVHGLANLERKGKIDIDFKQKNDSLFITITDNGIGIEASKKQKAGIASSHKSVGMTITKRRLEMLSGNSETGNIEVQELKDENGKVVGTKVTLQIPLEE